MKKFLKFMRASCLSILIFPYIIFGLGVLSNQAVLWANHDKFPVMLNARKLDKIMNQDALADIEAIFGIKPKAPIAKTADPDGMIDDVHCVMTSKTHLNALADVFDLGSIYSIGDFTLYLGEWLMGFTPFVWGYAVIKKLYEYEQ
jgi:hypothetical protein